MTELPIDLRTNGFNYHQLMRSGNVAIYEQKTYKDKLVGFEVIIIKTMEGKIFERNYEPHEVYPGSSDWGKLGFTFRNFDRAKAKFDELVKDMP